MLIIKGNKQSKITSEKLRNLTAQFKEVIVDLGTGDGRFVFKHAAASPDKFYIGVDPSAKSLEDYSKKAVNNKVQNSLYCVGSIEVLPPELANIANSVYINYPWGTLLQAVIKPTTQTVSQIKQLFKASGKLIVVFGYSPELEPSETQRLSLEPLDLNYIANVIVPAFESEGFKKVDVAQPTSNDIAAYESTWARKIRQTSSRPFFRIEFCA